jgi:hypothetical protein
MLASRNVTKPGGPGARSVPPVAAGDVIDAAWGNAVSDSIAALEAGGGGSAGLISRTVITSGTGTYSVPAGTGLVHVIGVAGGGAGGGTAATAAGESASGGGGAGGGAFDAWYQASAIDAVIDYSVGAGGTAPSNANGNNGGDTSFGASGRAWRSSATGGTGGNSGPNSSTASRPAGGLGGTGTVGAALSALTIDGGDGDNGCVVAAGLVPSGSGGGSYLADATRANNAAAGRAGHAYGGGGSAATSTANSVARSGGVGAGGVLIVEAWASSAVAREGAYAPEGVPK